MSVVQETSTTVPEAGAQPAGKIFNELGSRLARWKIDWK